MNKVEFCPLGHRVLHVPDSLLGPESWYCPDCDKLYQPVLQVADLSRFPPERAQEIKELALILEARRNVTKGDLIKLGYLTYDS
jgi:hypothetical protein